MYCFTGDFDWHVNQLHHRCFLIAADIVVKPATLIGWHRKAFRLLWKRNRSRAGDEFR
jgi:hypothetical protein